MPGGAAMTTLSGLAARPEIVSARITLPDGRAFAQYPRSSTVTKSTFGDGHFSLNQPGSNPLVGTAVWLSTCGDVVGQVCRFVQLHGQNPLVCGNGTVNSGEHYLPLLYILALQQPEEAVSFFAEGLPLGIELLSAAFTDARLLALGFEFEQLTQYRRAPASTPSLLRLQRCGSLGFYAGERTEALRIELAGGQRADSLIIDLARLFTDDAPGLREAGQEQHHRLVQRGRALLDVEHGQPLEHQLAGDAQCRAGVLAGGQRSARQARRRR